MILHHIQLLDFGIYANQHNFDLSPCHSSIDSRPVTVFRGKNGVGKSTILEAIKLCLHGPLAVGNRVSRSEYHRYLESRIHKNNRYDLVADGSAICLHLEFSNAGVVSNYKIERAWRKSGSRIIETVMITEDGQLLPGLTSEQKESWLRELLPPSAADIFFFDSEKLHLLADDESSSTVFGQTVRSLLGIDMIKRLIGDLDLYISRHSNGGNLSELHERIRRTAIKHDLLQSERARVVAEKVNNQTKLNEIDKAIAYHEQLVAAEGTAFSSKRSDLKLRHQQLLSAIEKQRSAVQELGSGLMPFAIASDLCSAVRDRLSAEERAERMSAATSFLNERLVHLSAEMRSDEFWGHFGSVVDVATRTQHIDKILAWLQATNDDITVPTEPLILHVSDKERSAMLQWIDQALGPVPDKVLSSTAELEELERELKQVEADLARIPSDDALKPLMEELGRLNQSLGALWQIERTLSDRIRQLDFQTEELSRIIRNDRASLLEIDREDHRAHLVIQTQNVLEQYSLALMREKVILLETALAERFNDLCRKDRFLDSATIDPETFRVTIYRGGQAFDRSQLSAGEKQLLATALMWALRQVSRLPIPVIIDTPVGRLDTDHRLTMVTDYFPNAGHQVILLATDAELDGHLLLELEPHVANSYELNYDSYTDETTVYEAHFCSGNRARVMETNIS